MILRDMLVPLKLPFTVTQGSRPTFDGTEVVVLDTALRAEAPGLLVWK